MGKVLNYGAASNDGNGDALHVGGAKIDAALRFFTPIDKDLTAPPGSPVIGDVYIVGGSATGDWASHDGDIAVYGLDATWLFIDPVDGMEAWLQDESALYRYSGDSPAGWGAITASGSGDVVGPASSTSQHVAIFDDGSGKLLDDGGVTIDGLQKPTESLIIACGDETTAITTGAGKVTFRMPYAFTLTGVRASVTTAPTDANIIIDINESNSSVLSTELSIDAGEKTSTTATTPAVISDSSLADDAEITIDFDQVGSTIAGAGVKVTLIGHRT